MRTCPAVFRLVLPGLTLGLLAACGGGGYGGGGGDSNPPATLSLSVEPTTITLGQSATLTWTTNGASCTAGGAWSGTKSAGGSEDVTPTETGTLTYTLTCAGGGYGESQRASATLTVDPASAFTQTLLVAGYTGSAALTTDSSLVNPRGISVGLDAPVRVVSGGRSNEYDGNGKRQYHPGHPVSPRARLQTGSTRPELSPTLVPISSLPRVGSPTRPGSSLPARVE